MKVKVVIDFYDKENNLKLRKKNEVFEAKEERARKLLKLGYVERIEELPKTAAT